MTNTPTATPAIRSGLTSLRTNLLGLICAGALALAPVAAAQGPAAQGPAAPTPPETEKSPKDGKAAYDPTKDFPKWDPEKEKYTEIVANLDGVNGLFRMWKDEKGIQIKVELPAKIEQKLLFLAYTIAGGVPEAGVQFGDLYGHFRRFDKQVAFIQPNLEVRSSGDDESKLGRERVFTDRVVFKAPIEGVGPGGGWIIDLTNLFGRGAASFFNNRVAGLDASLIEVTKAKGFPQNVELAFKVPIRGGVLATIHYSLSEIPEDTGYVPRAADERVGYFTTAFMDVGHPSKEDPFVRYINRWRIEKADPNLSLSPPKEPIVFYIEHTTPIRYRRWVRDGILGWNKAFEKIGIDGAVQVYQQDARTGAHMEKDPEDARYNFVLWTNANMGFAIGPSRVHPKTGEILDADIVMDEGFVNNYVRTWELVPEIVGQAFDPQTRAWLASRPQWDPRVQLAAPDQRARITAQLRAELAQSTQSAAPVEHASELLGSPGADGLSSRLSQVNGYCTCGRAKSVDLAIARMGELFPLAQADVTGDKPADEAKKEDPTNPNRPGFIDGLPENFVGPLIKSVIMHEVGHTLGLRHNFKGSGMYTMSDLNTDAAVQLSNSVMDYLPVNINMGDGPVQGLWCMTEVGTYDNWAIEYGYTLEKDLKPILAKVNDPGHAYATDEDTMGPDPMARRFDLAKDPLDFADSQMRLVGSLRAQILDRIVKQGESWSRARRAYETLLGKQVQAINVAADWIGGASVARNYKGDPGETAPVLPVDPAKQRRALGMVIEYSLRDQAFGLSPELLARLSVGRWMDNGGMSDIMAPPAWPIHDRILAIQTMALTNLLNPGTLARVYDNELMTPATADALTIPELLTIVRSAVWTEVENRPDGQFSDRSPMISSLRRNLQRQWTDRMIDLMLAPDSSGATGTASATLARAQLQHLAGQLQTQIDLSNNIDTYTAAHLSETLERVRKSLSPAYLYRL